MHATGQAVPNFSLLSDSGKTISNTLLLGSRYVLYFYPKDDTPGCTKEACGFRDTEVDFSKIKTMVFGISADSTASHEKFVKKYQLNFPLLSDPNRVLIEGLGCWIEKSMYGKKYMGIARATFVVDAKGVIEQVWEKVNVDTHAADVLAYLNGGASTASVAAKASSTKAAPAKKAVAKKVVAKKVAAKKVLTPKIVAKKAVTKKAVAKKAAAKKPATKVSKKK